MSFPLRGLEAQETCGPVCSPRPRALFQALGLPSSASLDPHHFLLLSEIQKSFWPRDANHAYSDPPNRLQGASPGVESEAGRTPPVSLGWCTLSSTHSLSSTSIKRTLGVPSFRLCDFRFPGRVCGSVQATLCCDFNVRLTVAGNTGKMMGESDPLSQGLFPGLFPFRENGEQQSPVSGILFPQIYSLLGGRTFSSPPTGWASDCVSSQSP